MSPARDAEVDELIRAAAAEGLQERAEGVERPQKRQKRGMNEDGEDEGEDAEIEEEENTQDLEGEPEKDEATEPASAARHASVDEQPTPTMKRPAGAGTLGKVGKGKGDSKSKKTAAIPKPGKGKQGKGKAVPNTVVPKAKTKLKKGAKGNTEPNTPQAKKRPEELLNRDDWFASEEKRLKDEMAEAQQC